MKYNFNLSNFNTEWIRYSDYEIKSEGEIKYIVPKDDSKYVIYNPFDVADKLLFDLIDLGDEALKENLNNEMLERKILLFAKKYGLLGLITSSVYNRNIVGEEKLLLIDNNIITKEKIINEDDYINLFKPFAKEEDVYKRVIGKHLTLFKAEDSPKFYGKRPLILDMVFSKFYGERITWILDFAKDISNHLNQIMIYRNKELTEPVTIMANKFKAQKISFSISVFDKPAIDWEFDSLESIIKTIYAFALTDEKFILNRCKYCNKAFVAKNEREKYCSPSCRNCINVINSRQRKKLEKELINNEDEITKYKSKDMEYKNMKNDKKRKEAIYEYKEQKTKGGVYKITNTINKKSLIKSEIDLRSSKNRFDFSVSNGSCVNLKLQKDWKEFGGESFKFEILEEIEMKNDISTKEFKEQLKKLEEKYLLDIDKNNLY